MFRISLDVAEHEMLPIATRPLVLPELAPVEHIWRMTNIRMFVLHQPLPYLLMIT